MSIQFWNNWGQEPNIDNEFDIVACNVGYKERCLDLRLGLLGFGVVIVINIIR